MGLRTWLGLKKTRCIVPPGERRPYMTADYYADLHESSEGYQGNNWLVPEIEDVLSCRPTSLLEIGFGNGRFLRTAAERVERVIGVDWVASPIAKDMPENVELVIADATKQGLPSVDLACSADVLEHFAPENIDGVLARLHAAGPFNFHVIACYDDKHSHLSIFAPEEWLERFRRLSPAYRLRKTIDRQEDGTKQVAVISNY